ncbi:DNA topoisomerase IB [Tundrisphaera sp. TA3]|uniref:DNA topoisomerase IB n=1 Tax=Tundrisphaera sp. TA3 TaxID=3435775 RepID=UPI003EBA2928
MARKISKKVAKPGPEIRVAPEVSARAAGLRYVSDETPGLTRVVTARGVSYRGADGKAIRDGETLGRIRSLAIPPAWTEVWICPRADGHLQATGRDARGRKQYRYHPDWRSVRDETKFGRMMAFADALPTIRRRVDSDLSRSGLPREKVLAAVVRLLETTLIRVGNEEYARNNRSFGLTTMLDRHVTVGRKSVRFGFKGKSGVRHDIDLDDPRLARIVGKCRDLPGQELFQYLDDDGGRHTIDSADVNAYLREAAGLEFTAKDFRTWAGTVLAAMALREFEVFDSEAQAKKNILRAIEDVAGRLGNTPTVCRKCYVHPEVIEAYLDGSMLRTLKTRAEAEIGENLANLRPEEAAVLALLQQRLTRSLEKHA